MTSAGIFLFLTGISAQTRILSIDELFRLADENSRSIRLHSLAVDEAEQGIKVARNQRLPSIHASLEFKYIGDGCMTDRNFSNAIHADMPHYGNSFVLKVSQVIYAGGAITRNIERSQLLKHTMELEYRSNRQDIRFLLLGYYLDLFQLKNQRLVYEKNIEQTQLLVKDMRAAYKQGTALKSDITRYELQLQNLELELTSTKNKIEVLNHRLTTTIGLDPNIQITPDTTTLMKQGIERSDEMSWLQEMANAPELQLADNQISLSRNAHQAVRAELRPHINLTAANDFSGPILIEVPPLNNNFTYWYAGVGISYNLDALFKSKKKLKQATVNTLKMEENRRLIQEKLEHEIHAAYIDLNEAFVRLQTQEKSVQLAHENFNIVRQRYINGLALITDMLDASNTQLDTELKLSNDQINILYQYYLLKKITGTL